MELETERDTTEEVKHPLSYTPRTSLGEKLLAIRAKIVATGAPLLSRDEIEKEVIARRGGYENNAL